MKKLVVISALMLMPVAAHADYYHNDNSNNMNALRSGWYAGASGDLSWLRNSNMGAGGNVDLGYQFQAFRLEGEAGYHTAGGRNGFGNTNYITYMGNVYFDLKNLIPTTHFGGWAIGPYVGGGAGDAQVNYGHNSLVTTFHHNHSQFAYEGMAGLNFTSPSMPNTDWRIGYRYLGTDETNIHSNNLELGLNFHF